MPKSVRGVMREFKSGALHSGSSTGPKVTTRKQAVAIALSEQRQLHPKLQQRAAAVKAAHAHLTATKPGYAQLPMRQKMQHMQAHVRKQGL